MNKPLAKNQLEIQESVELVAFMVGPTRKWRQSDFRIFFPRLIATLSLLVRPSFFFTRSLFLALMMEAVRASKSLVYFNETTRRYIAESYSLHPD
jgi:hypothetical protein